MTAFLLASRTARRYRARTLLAIAGVAVIGALLFDLLLGWAPDEKVRHRILVENPALLYDFPKGA